MNDSWIWCRNADALHLFCLLTLPLSLLAGITFRLITLAANTEGALGRDPNGPSAPELWTVLPSARSDILRTYTHFHSHTDVRLPVLLACHGGQSRWVIGYIIKQKNCDLEVWRWANFFAVRLLRRPFNDVGGGREADAHPYLSETWALFYPGVCFMSKATDFKYFGLGLFND